MTEFEPFERALINLTLARPSGDEWAQIRTGLAGAAVDWPRFRRLVEHNDVAPWVHRQLETLQMGPVEIDRRLADRRREVAAANAARLQVTARFLAAARARNVRVVVLKGVLFAETVYGEAGYKKMNDLDILVPFADIEAIKQIYDELGLIPLALLEGGGEAPDENKGHHLPAYVSPDLAFVVGTHWRLAGAKSGFRLDHAAMWRRVVPVTIAGESAWALAPRDNLLHLVVHFHYYKTGLKELGDVANLIRAIPDLDWGVFAEEVVAAGLQGQAYRVLRLVEALYGPLVPETMLAVCRAGAEPFIVADTDRLAARGAVLLASRSTWSSEIEKAYLRFTYESGFSAKLHAWLQFWHRLLLPPRAVLYRTNGCAPGEGSLHRLFFVNLWRTAREIGKGYGLPVFGLLMVKSVVMLLATLKPGTGDEGAMMAQLRAKFGNDEARLRKLLTMME